MAESESELRIDCCALPLPGELMAAEQSKVVPEIPTYHYRDLSKNGAEVFIEYEGKWYRLRTTKNGKLILNK